MVPALASSLPGAIGITRVARLTGLDRSGVEVAAAIRPRGHVLQVCNGKGETPEQAVAGAILEAAELWCAERVDGGSLRVGSIAELAGTAPTWGPNELGSAGELVEPKLWSSRTRLAWETATELVGGEKVLVPAQAVRCPAAGQPALGPVVVRWTTNGMGAHPSFHAALGHALLEAVERDQLARALPVGWTAQAVRLRMLASPTLGAAPRTSAAVLRIEERGFRVFLFDLGPRRSLGLPVAGALLVDVEGGPVPLAAGYACALRRDDALLGALLEAAQSRLTDIHGAREDIAQANPAEVALLRSWCLLARPRRSVLSMPERSLGPGRPADEVAEIVSRLGDRKAAFVDLAPASLGIHVVKVVVPSFRVSELL